MLVPTWVAPLARGWTLPAPAGTFEVDGCPARAGMDPGQRRLPPGPVRLPRSRGDGPA